MTKFWSSRKIAAAIVVVLVVVAGLVWFFHYRAAKIASVPYAYTIPDVPYYNVTTGVTPTTLAGAMYSILQYWGDTSTDPYALSAEYPVTKTYKLSDIEQFFKDKGYATEVGVLKSPDDLKKYINSEKRIPLFVFQRTTSSTPPFMGYPSRLVIGMDDAKKVVITHDYWMGNNFEVGYDWFFQLGNFINQQGFLAVYPKSEAAIASNKPKPVTYIPINDDERTLFFNFMVFRGWTLGKPSTTVTVTKIFNDTVASLPAFDTMSPGFKMVAYDDEGQALRWGGDLAGAIAAEQKAASFDKNIDQPYGKWPGFSFTANGRLTGPYKELGAIYEEAGKKDLAIQAFKEVLTIKASSTFAAQELKKLGATK